jgi:CheY-like chemotaxis protein
MAVKRPTTAGRRPHPATILVVNDVEEIRDGITLLLSSDGYHVVPARDEDDAVEQAKRQRPDLILVSLEGRPVEVIRRAARIRQKAALSDKIPTVIFCVPMIAEGAEVSIGHNLYATRPDNFNQLRAFLARLQPPELRR